MQAPNADRSYELKNSLYFSNSYEIQSHVTMAPVKRLKTSFPGKFVYLSQKYFFNSRNLFNVLCFGCDISDFNSIGPKVDLD